MLESLRLKGFQPHKNTYIEFDPLATSIVGSNDTGKTSILRALGFVCLNDPSSAEEVINWDEDKVVVTIGVDGSKVKRSRGPRLNTYSVDGKVFKAFGSEVPKMVKYLLRIGEVNFQNQHDRHFWFSDTPGKVSKNLNEIVHLDQIDEAMEVVASKLRGYKSRLADTRERLNEAEEREKQLSWVKQYAKDFERLLAVKLKLSRIRDKIAPVASILADGERLRADGDRAAQSESGAARGLYYCRRAVKATQDADSLARLIQDMEKIQAFSGKKALDIRPLERLKDKTDRLGNKVRDLDYLIQEISELEAKKCVAARKVRKLERVISKKTSKRCPLCGSKTKVKSLLSSSVIYTSGHQCP